MAIASEIKNVGGNIAAGLIAGAIGTAAMTAAQRAEMKMTGRSGSTTPAKGVEEVLDVEPEDKQAEKTLSQETHWAYGTALGGLCGLVASALDDSEPATGATFFALAWGGGMVMLPSLGIAPPPTQWGKKSLAMDAGFHIVYASATAAAYHGVKRALKLH